MKYDDLVNRLSDKEKQRLAEAKTQEYVIVLLLYKNIMKQSEENV